VKGEHRGNTIIAWRWILDSAPVPIVAKLGNFKGNVDRWHYYYLHAPSLAVIDFGSCEPGSIGPDAERAGGWRQIGCHFMTPVDERNTVDHWVHLRNFSLGDPATSESMTEQLRLAFSEDKAVLEAIQVQEDELGLERRTVRLGLDASSVRLHKLIEQMIAAEARSSPTLDKRTA
jgi:vanillate O-demethylase monooxygenase subunit